MTPSMLDRHDFSWLQEHAHEWVDAGLISPDQAGAIGQYELGESAASSRRLSIGAEVAAYLGSMLALMSGAVVISQQWNDMGIVGQVAIGVALAVVGFVSGALLIRQQEPGTARLASFLWVIGTGGVVVAVSAVLEQAVLNPESWNVVLVGVPIFGIGLALWRNLDRPLQLLTTLVGAGAIIGGLAGVVDAPVWAAGIGVWAAGIGAGLLARRGDLRPTLVALAASAIVAMIGGGMISDLDERVGPGIAALTAALIVFVALHDRLMPLLVIGVVGFLIATRALLSTTFTGPFASIVVTLIGLAIVVVAVARPIRSRPDSGPDER